MQSHLLNFYKNNKIDISPDQVVSENLVISPFLWDNFEERRRPDVFNIFMYPFFVLFHLRNTSELVLYLYAISTSLYCPYAFSFLYFICLFFQLYLQENGSQLVMGQNQRSNEYPWWLQFNVYCVEWYYCLSIVINTHNQIN